MAKKAETEKSVGVVRKIDQLGRITIPKEFRRIFKVVDNEDMFEIYVEGDKIILKKFGSGCAFCGKQEDLTTFKDMVICAGCIKEIKESV